MNVGWECQTAVPQALRHSANRIQSMTFLLISWCTKWAWTPKCLGPSTQPLYPSLLAHIFWSDTRHNKMTQKWGRGASSCRGDKWETCIRGKVVRSYIKIINIARHYFWSIRRIFINARYTFLPLHYSSWRKQGACTFQFRRLKWCIE